MFIHRMRETVSEKIRQNFIVKRSPNLFWQEIRQIDRAQSRSSRPGFIYNFIIFVATKMVGQKISPPLLVLLLDVGSGIRDG
jgi:hypothetical protein